MSLVVQQLSNNQKLLLGALDDEFRSSIHEPFICLVPAYERHEMQKVETLASALLDLGCMEFCCVGPEAEQLHDSIDYLIEDREAFDIITTWHTDTEDAVEYFLFVGGREAETRLALTASHPELVALLKAGATSDRS